MRAISATVGTVTPPPEGSVTRCTSNGRRPEGIRSDTYPPRPFHSVVPSAST